MDTSLLPDTIVPFYVALGYGGGTMEVEYFGTK